MSFQEGQFDFRETDIVRAYSILDLSFEGYRIVQTKFQRHTLRNASVPEAYCRAFKGT